MQILGLPYTCQRIICGCSLAYGYLISSLCDVSLRIKICELLSQTVLILPTQFETTRLNHCLLQALVDSLACLTS